jgi:hypothetical protein
MELDLHGVKHRDVSTLVEEFVLLHEPPMKVITGNSSKMKSLVREVIVKYEMPYVDFGPYILIG